MGVYREIRPGVFSVGVIDWDRRLFDELIPLPDGTSYNAYVVQGSERTALIDTADPPFAQALLDNLETLGLDRLDYVVTNHAEQDHSGSIPAILERFPAAKVVCTPRCRELLEEHLEIPAEKFETVKDREFLSLGEKTLEFFYTPWVHWPETMSTYLREEEILFPCDFFGFHYATSDLFADQRTIYEPAKRYYAEIMMPFRKIIQKNLEIVDSLSIKMIAPSHGPLHSEPSFIIEAYRDWSSDDVKNEVVVPFVSMHGSTELMVDHLVNALIARGIGVKRFDIAASDVGKMAEALVDAATLVLGACTILGGPHPNAAHVAFLANALRPKTRFASIIGSYGWGGKTVKVIQDTIPLLKVEMIEPVLAKGLPTEEDYLALDRLADEILKKHKELGIA
ncbi:FprA family A-type flavoprotein [Methanocrinis sp.]|uniref:FprA family A-type flavoprotein n=1 Tax=Methanocrinis sp. TaxID=3101522 RepID=UPI003D0F1F92